MLSGRPRTPADVSGGCVFTSTRSGVSGSRRICDWREVGLGGWLSRRPGARSSPPDPRHSSLRRGGHSHFPDEETEARKGQRFSCGTAWLRSGRGRIVPWFPRPWTAFPHPRHSSKDSPLSRAAGRACHCALPNQAVSWLSTSAPPFSRLLALTGLWCVHLCPPHWPWSRQGPCPVTSVSLT